jgi:raffinose/stachyose/melibiose transport system permease protein
MSAAGNTVDASSTMAINMFKSGYIGQEMGFGSALAVILFLFCFLVALGYQRLVLRRDIEGALTTYGG